MTHYDEKLTKGTGVHVRYLKSGTPTKYHYRDLGPDDSITVSVDPLPPPPPPPPPPTGAVYYIAPNGSDGNAGTQASPWKTILYASSKLKPGDTLYARGGTYTGQGGYDWTVGASGTPTAPILFAAYPGEVPVFDGQGAWSHWLIIHQAHDIIVRGFTAQNYSRGPSGDGVILVFDGAAGIVIEGNTLQDSGFDQLDHGVYVGGSANNITVRNNVIRRITGWGVHVYHDPGPTGMFVEGNTITDCRGGVIFASNGTNGTIKNNVFGGVMACQIERQAMFTNVVISGNSPDDHTCDIS